MKLKVKFFVQPTKVNNVPKGVTSILLTWRRGTKRHSGSLRLIDVNPKLNEGFWNEEFIVESKIEMDAKDTNLVKFDPKNFEEKSLSISVKDGKKSGLIKKNKVIGKVKLNLSEFINGSAKAITVTKPLISGSRKERPCEITLVIKAELLKLGTKTLSVVQTPQQGGIMLDGCNFALKTEDVHTETTIDNKSEEDSDEGDFFEDDDFEKAEKTEKAEKEKEKKGSAISSPGTEKRETISPSTSPPPEKTISTPSVTANNSTSEITKRAVSKAATPTTTTPSTPSSTTTAVVRYNKFSDRPLAHKVLASIVILCALLAIRIALI